MSYNINWKLLAKYMLQNTKINTSSEKVRWLQNKCFRIQREHSGIIKYRYKHYGPYYGRGRPPTIATLSLQQAYLGLRSISLAKFYMYF